MVRSTAMRQSRYREVLILLNPGREVKSGRSRSPKRERARPRSHPTSPLASRSGLFLFAVRSIAGHRTLAKIHNVTRLTMGIKNAIVHHLLNPTRPKIFAIGMAWSTRNTVRMIECQRLNDCMPTLPHTLQHTFDIRPVSP